MNEIRFNKQEKEKIQKALELFFDRSDTKGDTITGLNTFDIISYLGFLVDYGYFVDCYFGQGNKMNSPYITFIRIDTPNIKSSYGVFFKICFNRKLENANKIEMTFDKSRSKKYKFKAQHKINFKNSKSFFTYSNYDIDAIIAKLEQDLQWFLQIPANELESY